MEAERCLVHGRQRIALVLLGIIAFPQAAARAGGVGDVLTVTGLILPK
jgi:hypothetical protein